MEKQGKIFDLSDLKRAILNDTEHFVDEKHIDAVFRSMQSILPAALAEHSMVQLHDLFTVHVEVAQRQVDVVDTDDQPQDEPPVDDVKERKGAAGKKSAAAPKKKAPVFEVNPDELRVKIVPHKHLCDVISKITGKLVS